MSEQHTSGKQQTSTLGLIRQTFRDFSEDDCPRMAAALAYYTVFSLPPLLLLILLIMGAVMDPKDVQDLLASQIHSAMGPQGKQEIQEIIRSAQETKQPDASRPLAAVLGVAALIFGATGAFAQLQEALNRAWEVAPDPERGGIRQFITKRVFSFGMILGIAFLLLVSLALSTALTAFGGVLGRATGLPDEVMLVFNFVLSFVVFAALFTAMFKVIPDATISWRDVWVGGLVTAILFVAGKYGLSFYLSQSDPGEAFGNAGALAVVLVWIYYASMILFFGAEFTQVWAERRGRGIRPEPGAVRMVEEKRIVRDGRSEPAGG